MSEPEIEIDRRCTFCGVSVRQHAAFCPQCGNLIKTEQAAPTTIVLSDKVLSNPPIEPVKPDLAATQPLSAVAPSPVLPKATDHSVRGRVEQIRKVSSVVIDQAAYDPSLRFLLVAAAFFILFLVLLILSKVIG